MHKQKMQLSDFRNVDVRPGKQMRMSVEEAAEFIRNSPKMQGYQFNLETGNNENLAINLPGNSVFLCGFAIIGADRTNPSNGRLDFTLNNEKAVIKSDVQFFGPDFTDEDYYPLPRPLSGQDTFDFSINDVLVAYPVSIIFYYI